MEKSLKNLETSSCSSLGYQQGVGSSITVSSSELSYLKAQVWTLQNMLKIERRCAINLTESFEKLANEKYELLEELTKQKRSFHELFEKLDLERDNNSVLLNEMECLQQENDYNRAILDKTTAQNVELRESMMAANDTIQQIGRMYLKLKGRPNKISQ